SEKDETAIRALFQMQQDAWNAEDIDRFMAAYWNSPNLIFIGRNGPTYGWQQVLDNYKRNYPGSAEMGKLKFEILDVSQIDRKSVFLIGKYHLTRTIGDASGNFSLVLQKIKGEWLIISDHSD
ncbi:MAG: nuclear transport factor 2 family protein, partial [Bacteroidales bacterium]|nr:nuclear transport factor 2 family protein [Bacteroidales bacterium]